MPEQQFRHAIECSAETYWRCMFDEEFNRKLYVDTLKFRRFEFRENTHEGDVRRRKLFLEPPPASNLPGPVAKLAGDLSWIEEGTYDAKSGRYRFVAKPSSLPDKTRIEGTIVCEPKGERAIERVTNTLVEVKVFVVGSMIEKMVLDDMRRSNEQAAAFTSRFVKEMGW